MEIVLHAGAHRTGTTTFEGYMTDRAEVSARNGLAFWGPQRVRRSVYPGVFPGPRMARRPHPARRATGRVALLLQRLEAAGSVMLLVSDPGMIETPRQCLQRGALYPAAGERMARLYAAFGGRVTRIVLVLRAQDLFWASLAASAVNWGCALPDAERLERIAASGRTWRDVITDIACAMPDTRIEVLRFERAAGCPEAVLAAATGYAVRPSKQVRWLNRSPDHATLRAFLNEVGRDPGAVPDMPGRWQPFGREQAARLAETYADDMHWLAAGADGLATLVHDETYGRAGPTPPMQDRTEGQGYDIRQGQVARPG
jgi:hypothetical protein